jgi:hypothetical protein
MASIQDSDDHHDNMNRSATALQGLSKFRTAILHQGGPAPAVGGVVKPFKPGGEIVIYMLDLSSYE